MGTIGSLKQQLTRLKIWTEMEITGIIRDLQFQVSKLMFKQSKDIFQQNI